MEDHKKTKQQLLDELIELRQQVRNTKHKQAEEGRKYRGYLEGLVEERTSELIKTNEELQQEIIERKRVEAALRDSKERYRQLVELSPDAIFVHSEGKFIFINNSSVKLLGAASAGIILKKPVVDFIHPDYREMAIARWRQVQQEGKTVPVIEKKFLRLDGTVIDVEVAIAPLRTQGKTIIQSVVRDITERKRMEQELQTAQEQLQDTLEFLPDATFVIDHEQKVIAWNRAMEEMTGVRKEDIIGKGDYIYGKIFYGKQRPILIDLIFADHKEIERKYRKFQRKDGKLYAWTFVPHVYGGKGAYLWGTASPLYDHNGNLLGAIETLRDFTEHKLTMKALRLSEERFSKAFHSCPCLFGITRAIDNSIVDANDYFLNNLGYHREEIIGRNVLELNIWANPEERAKIISMLNNKQSVRNVEVDFYTKSGELRHVLLSAELIVLGGEECIMFLCIDITQHKLMSKEMARLERLNLIGEMAAGIGHEIRNPMTTVRGFLQMLEKKEEYAKHKEYFKIMIEELDRANSIIKEYLSMAKNKAVDLKCQNLNPIVEVLLPLIQADAMNADKYIEVELQELPNLFLDEKEIRQLILNLVRNGLEAMSPKGKLMIRTFINDGDVVLSVRDQGTGMTPEVLEKIGTPFFTTKESGTGLGLAVCYSIAARHNATIAIKTGSWGTTLLVRFKTVADALSNETY